MPGLTQTFKAALTDVDTVAIEPLGTIRYDQNAVYKYVKFSGTTANVAGDPVGYVVADTTAQTVDGGSFAASAGVAMATHGTGSASYGWIQTKGIASVNGTTGGSAGSALKMSASKTVVVRAAVTDNLFGFTVAAGTPAFVLLDCPN